MRFFRLFQRYNSKTKKIYNYSVKNNYLKNNLSHLSKQDCLTYIALWSSPVRLICNCHCTFMAVLCIGAEQIEVL